MYIDSLDDALKKEESSYDTSYYCLICHGYWKISLSYMKIWWENFKLVELLVIVANRVIVTGSTETIVTKFSIFW